PILHLREAQALRVLADAGEVMVPSAVDGELARLIPDWPNQRPSWLVVFPPARPPDPMVEQLSRVLGTGESEAIALARSLPADWLLTDDAEARAIARLAGIEVHGSVGVVLWGASTRRLDPQQAHAALENLARSSLWLSATILDEARAALREILQRQ
ncbi:MAG: hypothetical protein ACREQY_17455, partial [Candidatus Binatia bacterium]